jgi:hypothetical protein
MVTGGAKTPIVARKRIDRMCTARQRITSIGGAIVIIVTIDATPNAAKWVTKIVFRTCVAVIATHIVGFKDTPVQRITGIIGTKVAVIAINDHSTLTGPVSTGITKRARVTVITG